MENQTGPQNNNLWCQFLTQHWNNRRRRCLFKRVRSRVVDWEQATVAVLTHLQKKLLIISHHRTSPERFTVVRSKPGCHMLRCKHTPCSLPSSAFLSSNYAHESTFNIENLICAKAFGHGSGNPVRDLISKPIEDKWETILLLLICRHPHWSFFNEAKPPLTW